jgi:FKBP-type peptidyl-prolyl cis-trans isomerase SlyD
MFCIDGKFDHEHVRIDAIVPLQNQEGDRFMARVLDIRDDVVVMDFNHPLAGRDLQFVGSVVESRDATEAEVDRLIRQLTGADGCGQCGGCGGGGGCGDCAEGDAGCPGGKGGCCHKG